MNDEELLRYAAKAAGFVEPHSYRPKTNCLLWVGKESGAATWRPLDDDAEAFRLMVTLGIVVDTSDGVHVQYIVSGVAYPISIYEFDDPCATTRRAIVRAAAEIGKQQKEQHGN
jgi:hypothetical protein